MRLPRRSATTVLASLLLLATFAAPAHAYIDGGSATVLFQALVAGAATAGLSVRLGWRRLTGRGQRPDGQPNAASVDRAQARGAEPNTDTRA
jgi:hypothetical protein